MAAIYLGIATQLREEIRTKYESGALLPSESRLAERFNVNRHTVRRAIDELVHDGLIRRHQGLGNLVIEAPISYALNNPSCFTYNLSKVGLPLETRVLDCRSERLSSALAEHLGLPVDSPMVVVETARSIDRKPATLIKHHLFNVPLEHLESYSQGSLHQFLREHFQFDANRGTTVLRTRMPSFQECQKLAIGRGIPVMEIHSRYNLKTNGMLMEYSISISRGDLFEYSVEP